MGCALNAQNLLLKIVHRVKSCSSAKEGGKPTCQKIVYRKDPQALIITKIYQVCCTENVVKNLMEASCNDSGEGSIDRSAISGDKKWNKIQIQQTRETG